MDGEDVVDDFKVAVVGMACFLPKARDLGAYWRQLLRGNELLSHFTRPEVARILDQPEQEIPENLVASYGFIEDGDCFDHQFFGFTRHEALRLDPQHRVFLQTCWHALEDAGCNPSLYPGRIGVFAGAGPSDYYYHLKRRAEHLARVSDWELKVDTSPDFLASRVAYKLGFRGPAVAVQTACSTSLVAIHLGVQSLLAGDSDLVLAGGVTLSTVPKFDPYDDGGITAKDGHCRPFDAHASGTIGSSGCGVVALKLLKEAIRDGDSIYGVVLGSAINNDGNSKMSFSSPSIIGQREAISRALEAAGVVPDSVGFIEAHGTGTILGDPIEVASLHQAYRLSPDSRCYLGSVKSNLGHTDAAAGVSGFIKAVLALHHGVIPPTLHFNSPNPNLRLEETSFRINRECVDWPDTGYGTRRAAVNSLGLGGTNAHVVLEEYKDATLAPHSIAPDASGNRKTYYLPISAHQPAALRRRLDQLADFARENPGQLAALGAALQRGRTFAHRACVLASDASELVQGIERARRGLSARPRVPSAPPKACFVFPGQGGQYEGMGAALLEEGGVFAATAQQCVKIFEELGVPLGSVLWPGAERGQSGDEIHRMTYAQASVFTLEVSLAFHFKDRIRSDIHALLGHSLGAYAAACLAGIFSLRDACRIVHQRALTFEQLEPGAMLAVLASANDLRPLIPETVSIAAINHPSQVVLSGRSSEIAATADLLKRMDVDCRPIHVSRAAHSSMLDDHLGSFERFLETVSFGRPALPIVSDFTGDWANEEEIATPRYWASHLRHVVRFSDAAGKLLREPNLHIFELGPGRTLTSLIASQPDYRNQPLYQTVPSVNDERGSRPDRHALARAWEAGIDVDWPVVAAERTTPRVPIPGYPFTRNRFDILAARPIRIEAEESEAEQKAMPIADSCPYRSETLALFHELFGDQSIEGHDDFFGLGGDSLLALRLFRAIRAKFSIELPLKSIFTCQTAYSLADEVKRVLESETANV